MKTSFFVIACAIAIAAFSTSVNAQDTSVIRRNIHTNRNSPGNKTFIWSIGVEPSIPVGRFNDYSGFGLGGSLQGEYKPGNKVGLTINAGYIDYFGKTVDSLQYSDFKYWPVMG